MSSDFGIKVSQPGKDAPDAGDQDLLSSSSWPNPKIIFNGRITATTEEIVQPTVSWGKVLKHNLGYVPFFIHYIPNDQFDAVQGTFIFRNLISADKNNIYIGATSGGAAQLPFDVGLIVFAIDIEKNFKTPSIDVGSSSTSRGDENFGMRLTKQKKDIDSNDLRDYLIHSRTRSPMIHEVINGFPTESASLGKDFVYGHDLPYDPMFFAYIQPGPGRSLAPPYAYGLVNGFAGVSTSGKTIRINQQAGAGYKVSLIVLKDPFIIDDNKLDIRT